MSKPPGAINCFDDKGFIALIDDNCAGSDLTVVNAARVSFGGREDELTSKGEKLIAYLAEHKHMSPFRHPQICFHLKAPEAIMRQAYKHVVGVDWTSGAPPIKDHAWNEISGRYVMYEDIYTPVEFRPQSVDNKQASEDGDLSDVLLDLPAVPSTGAGVVELPRMTVRELYEWHQGLTKVVYQAIAGAGVAKEQARLVMPFATYTEVIWSCSLEAVVNFIKLRQHAGAQKEIQGFADAVLTLTKSKFPVSMEALLKYL